MSLRRTFASKPWIAGSAAFAVICIIANIALFLYRGGLQKEYSRQRDRERAIAAIAEDCQRFKTDMTLRSGRLASPGALDVERIEELGALHRVANELKITIPAVRTADGLTERVVDLTLVKARRQDLAGFLFAVESLDPGIRTRSLRIVESRGSSRLKEKMLVDAKIQFSAYEKAPIQIE